MLMPRNQQPLSLPMRCASFFLLLILLVGCNHNTLTWRYSNTDLTSQQFDQQTTLLAQLPNNYESLTGQATNGYDALFAVADKIGTRSDGMKAYYYSIPNSGDDGSATTLIIYVVDECIDGILFEPANL
jgi:hypothetical protein